jgi:DNA-binding CsgD family transcriptional regulator
VLVGRDGELGAIRGLVDGLAAARGGALLLRGDAGIGKTALLEGARDMAPAATVLACQGIESESNLPFGALRDLVWPVVDARAELPPPQRDALGGALALGPPAPGDRLAVCVATLGVLEAAAENGPVLALVDDAQWLDDASRECVAYAARRARGRLGILLTLRAGGEGTEGWDGIPALEIGPLDRGAAVDLLDDTAPELAADVREAIAAAAGGNPLALVELPAVLSHEQRRGDTPLDEPLAPGRGLERVYSARLAELPEDTRTALLVAAACDGGELAPVAAAARALGSSAGALQAAEAAGLIELHEDRVAFGHPLVRGAVYHGSPAPDRRAAHRALAAAVDHNARAWHLAGAAVGPDEEAAAALEEMAGVAASRRAYAVAADALERAARLSEDPARSAPRLLGAGASSLAAGRAPEAAAFAEQASARAGDPVTRAGAEHLRAVVTLWSGRVAEARELLEASADGAAAANPAMAALILADASFACCAAGDCPRALELAERARDLLGDNADPAVRAPVVAVLSWALILRGKSSRARPLMDEAIELAPKLDPFSPAAQLVLIALNCRLPREDYEAVLADALARADAARESGSLYALPMPLATAAQAADRLGRWHEADDLCADAIAAAEETGQWGPAATAAAVRTRLAAARGQEVECRADAASALTLAESSGVGSMAVYAHGALGFLELSLGRVEAAIEELELTERLVAEAQMEEPTIIPWAPDLVEAYVRAGRHEPARRVLATLERQAQSAGTGGAAALAERCRGLLAGDDFDDHFARALEHNDRGPMPFERARTLLAWGMRLHRARRRVAARERLREAAAAFGEVGAAAWEDTARAELRAAGGRQRRPLGDELTAQEERVARAAGRGATTQEIAAELYLSPKTVEFHLGRAYRKLGVRSRAELATVIASGELARAPAAQPRI